MTNKMGEITILHQSMLLTMPSNQDKKATISSELPMLLLKRDIRVVNVLATMSGWQC